MNFERDLQSLRDELSTARLEESEALRRAHHLRAFGASADARTALREVDARHSAVARLTHELKEQELSGSGSARWLSGGLIPR